MKSKTENFENITECVLGVPVIKQVLFLFLCFYSAEGKEQTSQANTLT